ncbi:hypothetical protein PaG_01984 [Moesziomyces aphidis]|uniref:Uncharacterized protein n=1 Tax=Moesziomyces aphidis TaxID=84754 RepID=W3VPR3_MOEAP|nr:hypothetical protein PaG_01984 [Moesziomyces aphidis]
MEEPAWTDIPWVSNGPDNVYLVRQTEEPTWADFSFAYNGPDLDCLVRQTQQLEEGRQATGPPQSNAPRGGSLFDFIFGAVNEDTTMHSAGNGDAPAGNQAVHESARGTTNAHAVGVASGSHQSKASVSKDRRAKDKAKKAGGHRH